jgi:hypothetical protein
VVGAPLVAVPLEAAPTVVMVVGEEGRLQPYVAQFFVCCLIFSFFIFYL